MCMMSLYPQTQKQQGKTSERIFKKQPLHANNLYVEEEPVPSFLFPGRLHRMLEILLYKYCQMCGPDTKNSPAPIF